MKPIIILWLANLDRVTVFAVSPSPNSKRKAISGEFFSSKIKYGICAAFSFAVYPCHPTVTNLA